MKINKDKIFGDLYGILDEYDLEKNDLTALFNEFTSNYVDSKEEQMWEEIKDARDELLFAFGSYLDTLLECAGGDEKNIEKTTEQSVKIMESELVKLEKILLNDSKKNIKDISDANLDKILKYIMSI